MSTRTCTRCADLSSDGNAVSCEALYSRDERSTRGGAIIVVVVCPEGTVDSTRNALAGIARSNPDDCGITDAVGVYNTCLYSEAGGGQGTAVTPVSRSWERPAKKTWYADYGDYYSWSHGVVFPNWHWHGGLMATVFLAAMHAEEVATWCLEAAQCEVEPVCMLRYADSGAHLDKVRQLVPLLAESATERYRAVQKDVAKRNRLARQERQRAIEAAKAAVAAQSKFYCH